MSIGILIEGPVARGGHGDLAAEAHETIRRDLRIWTRSKEGKGEQSNVILVGGRWTAKVKEDASWACLETAVL